jgi:hypothetical protein
MSDETKPAVSSPPTHTATVPEPRLEALEAEVAKLKRALAFFLTDPCAAVAKKAKAILES